MSATRSITSTTRSVRSALAIVLLIGLAPIGAGCSLFGSGGGSGSSSPPAAPTNLSATSGNNQISLDWTAVDAADTYNVYRATSSSSTSPSDNDPIETGVSDPSYTDSGAENGTTYAYVVTAVNNEGKESDPSNKINEITPFSSPGGRPPTNALDRSGSEEKR